jgi:hypothetical protein
MTENKSQMLMREHCTSMALEKDAASARGSKLSLI